MNVDSFSAEERYIFISDLSITNNQVRYKLLDTSSKGEIVEHSRTDQIISKSHSNFIYIYILLSASSIQQEGVKGERTGCADEIKTTFLHSINQPFFRYDPILIVREMVVHSHQENKESTTLKWWKRSLFACGKAHFYSCFVVFGGCEKL